MDVKDTMHLVMELDTILNEEYKEFVDDIIIYPQTGNIASIDYNPQAVIVEKELKERKHEIIEEIERRKIINKRFSSTKKKTKRLFKENVERIINSFGIEATFSSYNIYFNKAVIDLDCELLRYRKYDKKISLLLREMIRLKEVLLQSYIDVEKLDTFFKDMNKRGVDSVSRLNELKEFIIESKMDRKIEIKNWYNQGRSFVAFLHKGGCISQSIKISSTSWDYKLDIV